MIANNLNYPLKFKPFLYGKIWRGGRLKEILQEKINGFTVEDDMEISSREGTVSTVQNGTLAGATLQDLINSFGASFMGKKNLEVFGAEEIDLFDYFEISYLYVQKGLSRDYTHLDSFVIFMCARGEGYVSLESVKEEIKAGETILIPAISRSVSLESTSMELLEIYVPEKQYE